MKTGASNQSILIIDCSALGISDTLEKSHSASTVLCKKFIVKFTKYLGNFGTKLLGKICKPICIFRKIGHTIKTNRITFSTKYFGPGVTKKICLNYKQNMRMMQNTVCLLNNNENLY